MFSNRSGGAYVVASAMMMAPETSSHQGVTRLRIQRLFSPKKDGHP
jgi:hypothetical protein